MTIYTRKLGSKASAELHVLNGRMEATKLVSDCVTTVLDEDAYGPLADFHEDILSTAEEKAA
ncbi:MAG TPA: hypothetical protein VFA45_24065 [Actinomycetes bacterium]|jgi:hypothetical protein|nr:hypothetical protein [Actinomycetes bacterium]